jgi:hypothetical protein
MKKNIGTVDRAFRVVAGLSIIGLGIFYGNWLGVVGVLPLVTATLGWCPAYVPFGFSSCKVS